MSLEFYKYHALGNDYLVLKKGTITPFQIKAVCERHTGVGADGILSGEPINDNTFRLRIYNADGSEAEKSGNGLRIFTYYLWEKGLVKLTPFYVETLGGTVICQVAHGGKSVTVQMGTAHATFLDDKAHAALLLPPDAFYITQVDIGNPHCVIHCHTLSPEEARIYGSAIEQHPLFPNKTNVQLVHVINPHHIHIDIWERGSGYTLSSGSSSCAAAAASVKRGLCEPGPIRVDMPGGTLNVNIAPDFSVTLEGPVEKIAVIQVE